MIHDKYKKKLQMQVKDNNPKKMYRTLFLGPLHSKINAPTEASKKKEYKIIKKIERPRTSSDKSLTILFFY